MQSRFLSAVFVVAVAIFTVSCSDQEVDPGVSSTLTCEGLPRATNAALTESPASDNWFEVYESADNVYSITEPFQFQETISHLVVGEERAVLFDTGTGLYPIRS